jgi:hypothetical protein
VAWSSLPRDVATIDENGTAIGRKAGQSITIRAMSVSSARLKSKFPNSGHIEMPEDKLPLSMETRFGKFIQGGPEIGRVAVAQKGDGNHDAAAVDLDLRLSEKFILLTNAEKKIKPQARVLKDIASHATDNSSDKAAIAEIAQSAAAALETLFESFQEQLMLRRRS